MKRRYRRMASNRRLRPIPVPLSPDHVNWTKNALPCPVRPRPWPGFSRRLAGLAPNRRNSCSSDDRARQTDCSRSRKPPERPRGRALICRDAEDRGIPRIGLVGFSLPPRTGVRGGCSITFCLRAEHEFCLERETSNIESRRIGRIGRPRMSNGDGTAREPLRADELDGGTGPSEHDGSVGNQSPPSRAERE